MRGAASTPSSSAADTTGSSAPRISRAPACPFAFWNGATCSAAPRSPRNSIRDFAIRRRATPSACCNPKVIRDLDLARHGLSDRRAAGVELPAAPGRRHLIVGGGLAATQAHSRNSQRDADALPGLLRDARSRRRRAARSAARDAAFGGAGRALLDAWKVAKRFRALDLAGRRDVLDLFTKSAGDVLDRWFESAPIKAVFGFDAVVGNFASP